MIVRFHTFEQFHNKKGVGSTLIRVHNLIKYWPEAGLYKYGEKADALIFQKIYATPDYDFPIAYKEGIKILDICDPDWLDGHQIKRTVDGMDGVVVPTETLKEFLSQLTTKPIKIIRDRFDLEKIPTAKYHSGKAKKIVWFGYAHNAETVRMAMSTIKDRGYEFTIIANEDPRWPSNYIQSKYHYVKYSEETFFKDLQEHDIVLFPKGLRPVDRFKSENKTIKAWLAGMPVAKDLADLKAFDEAEIRNREGREKRQFAIKNYDCKISVSEYKAFIKELQDAKN